MALTYKKYVRVFRCHVACKEVVAEDWKKSVQKAIDLSPKELPFMWSAHEETPYQPIEHPNGKIIEYGFRVFRGQFLAGITISEDDGFEIYLRFRYHGITDVVDDGNFSAAIYHFNALLNLLVPALIGKMCRLTVDCSVDVWRLFDKKMAMQHCKKEETCYCCDLNKYYSLL